MYERSTIYGVSHLAGGDQCAECVAVGGVGLGSVAVRHAGAAMSDALGTICGAIGFRIFWWLLFDRDTK